MTSEPYIISWGRTVLESLGLKLQILVIPVHKQHFDHIQFHEAGEPIPISVVYSITNECILDRKTSKSNIHSDRHTTNPRKRRTINYRNSELNLGCGGCSVCTN